MKAFRHARALLTMGLISSPYAARAAQIGPSFACPRPAPIDAVAQMICDHSDAAREELSFEQPYYALRWLRGESEWKTLKTQAIGMDAQLRTACGFPPVGSTIQTLPAGADQCYAQQVDGDRKALLSQLSGSALQEASRPVEQQIAIQQKLISLGFLPPSTTADGVFGTTTRLAITTWQRINHRPTSDGFISDADMPVLLTQPSVAAASPPGLAAPSSTPASTSDQATASQVAQPPDSSKSRVSPQGIGADKFFSDPDGIAYAAQKLTTWSVKTSQDEMTSREVVKVTSEQTNDSGVTADVTGSCQDGSFAFQVTITNADDPEAKTGGEVVPLADTPSGQIARVQYRVNNLEEKNGFLEPDQFTNRFDPVLLTNIKTAQPAAEGFGLPSISLYGVWRILVQFETNGGQFILRIPIYDPAVEQAIEACQAS